jgi:hypothetical protein
MAESSPKGSSSAQVSSGQVMAFKSGQVKAPAHGREQPEGQHGLEVHEEEQHAEVGVGHAQHAAQHAYRAEEDQREDEPGGKQAEQAHHTSGAAVAAMEHCWGDAYGCGSPHR